MPTSPRDLTDRTGGMIRINHPLWPRTFRADVGIRPYAGERFLPLNLARPILSCVPSTPAAYGRHPLQAGEGMSCSYLAAGKSTGLPRQCAHCLAMTFLLFWHFVFLRQPLQYLTKSVCTVALIAKIMDLISKGPQFVICRANNAALSGL